MCQFNFNLTKSIRVISIAILLVGIPLTYAGTNKATHEDDLALYDHPTPYLSDGDLPKRTAPLEFSGDPMLAPGKISEGHTLSTGAHWNPSFWVFGSFRTAFQGFRTGNRQGQLEWMNRLDLFGNWQISPTERILIGFRPLQEGTRFTGQIIYPDEMRGFQDALNANITTLFFEGDLGELFPKWAAKHKHGRDIGFAIGRQRLFFQEGMFINDTLDAIGITQNSMHWPWATNVQITLYGAFSDIERDNNLPDNHADIAGAHARLDTKISTIDVDLAYVFSPVDKQHFCGGDLFVVGASSVARIGRWGTTFRVLGSVAPHETTQQADDGVLFFAETNIAPYGTHDIFYVNGVVVAGKYTAVARDADVGGSLGRLGILFASAGIGGFGSAIPNVASHLVGATVGYEKFFNEDWQGILEVAGRIGTTHDITDQVALGGRLQVGIGRRSVLRFDAFFALREHQNPGYGLRAEWLTKI